MTSVCHITSAHPRDDIRIFFRECVSMAEQGFDVCLVAEGVAEERVHGVTVYGLQLPRSGRMKRMVRGAAIACRFALSLKADIYLLQDPELLPYALKLKRRGYIVIYDAHEDLPRQIASKEYIPSYLRRIIAFAVEKYENYVARKLNCIFTATPHITQRFLKINPCTHTISNYPLPGEYITNEGSPEERTALCYTGVITRSRGIMEMLEAAALSGTKLILAGRFDTPELEQQVLSSPAWSSADYRGSVKRTELGGIMAASFAGLVCFHPESNHLHAQPNKLFEYMAAGIPLICSDFPLWKEMVEGNDCGLCVNPLNPAAIAEAVAFLRQNPDRATAMGNNGRSAVRKLYNWNVESTKMASVYQQLVLSKK